MQSKTELEKQVHMLVRNYNMSTVILRNAVSKKAGINITDMECLSLLMIKGISSPTELAQYTGMTSGSATVMLDRLENAGLIERRPNPKDRRGVLIEINQQAMSQIGALFVGTQIAQDDLITGYTEHELRTIADFLTRFTDNMTSQVDAMDKH
jgi:DNA-binding MarR family transcriptional regulator